MLPCPGALRRRISPPSKLANSRLMARPNPVPPYFRLVLASACWKASKIMRCLSTAIPTPVSETSNARTGAPFPQDRMVRRPPACRHRHREIDCSLLRELERVRQQILEHLLQTLRVRDQAARQMRIGMHLECQLPCFSASCRNGRSTVSSRLLKNTSSASTETVPDSIFDRSRMSVIRFSKSVPAP